MEKLHSALLNNVHVSYIMSFTLHTSFTWKHPADWELESGGFPVFIHSTFLPRTDNDKRDENNTHTHKKRFHIVSIFYALQKITQLMTFPSTNANWLYLGL